MKKFISFAVVLAMLLTGVTAVSAANEECALGENCPSADYVDLAVGDWFHEDVDAMLVFGIMEGVAENTFAPNEPLTRAMFVTILHRTIGEPEVNTDTTFTDVEADSWYEKAVAWAEVNDVTNGCTATTFLPEDHVTREQMATMLYRFADRYILCDTDVSADLSDFSDSEEVSDWAVEAMKWAVAQNIFRGDENGALNPTDDAERCQAAAVVVRLSDSVNNDMPEGWEGDVTPAEELTTNEEGAFVVTTPAEFAGALNSITDENYTIELEADLNLNGQEWTPVAIGAYEQANSLIVNGNGHVISGLTDMLVISAAQGAPTVEFYDLTISDSYIEHDADDEIGTVGVGAFLGFADGGLETLVLSNCHVVNSVVSGGHWTGGLIGYAAGYNKQNDGPCFLDITVENCSVINTVVTGKGSCGSVIGHATGSLWTKLTIEDCVIDNNTILSTGDSDNKAGYVMGTVGAAGPESYGKTGGVYLNNTVVEHNYALSNETEITTVYGRQGTSTGKLFIDGVEVQF